MKELTKEQKLSAIFFMRNELNLDYDGENVLYGLCTHFSFWMLFMKLKKSKNDKFIDIFPELYKPIKNLQYERESGFAWKSGDYHSRLNFLNDLEKQIRQQEPTNVNT